MTSMQKEKANHFLFVKYWLNLEKRNTASGSSTGADAGAMNKPEAGFTSG